MNRTEVIEALAKGPSGDAEADAALMRTASKDMRDLMDWFLILSRACDIIERDQLLAEKQAAYRVGFKAGHLHAQI